MDDANKNSVVVIEAGDPRWKVFLGSTPHTIFHTPSWNAAISRAYGIEPRVYALCGGEEIKIALVGLIFDWKICRVLQASLFDGGLVGDRRYLAEFTGLLPEALRRDRIDRIRVEQTYSAPFDGLPGFKKFGASQHIVHLESVNEGVLWDTLYRNRARKAIRQARNKGVELEEITGLEGIKVLYKLNRTVIERNRAFSIFNQKALEEFYNCFISKGQGKAWLAKMDGRYIAGLLVVYSDTVSHAMAAGSLSEFFHCRANDLLLHEGIVDAIRKGKRYFDFMMSPEINEQLKLYKTKFGVDEYQACMYEKDFSSVRPRILDMMWKIAHSRPGAMLLRLVNR